MTTPPSATADLSSTIVGVSAMLTGIVTAAMTMRLGSRLVVMGGLSWEDGLAICSWVCGPSSRRLLRLGGEMIDD
jgi:hypothetical protein